MLPGMSTFNETSKVELHVGSDQNCSERPLLVGWARIGGGMKGAMPCMLMLAAFTFTKYLDS